MSIFNAQFWKNALESTLVAFLSTFTAAFGVQGGYTLKGLTAAAIAGGMGALYAFVKQLGAVQLAQSVTKVSTPQHPTSGA